jgi:very-short-patch-repair endonuclease
MARVKKETTPQPVEHILWASADKLRKNMDAAEYKHISILRERRALGGKAYDNR